MHHCFKYNIKPIINGNTELRDKSIRMKTHATAPIKIGDLSTDIDTPDGTSKTVPISINYIIILYQLIIIHMLINVSYLVIYSVHYHYSIIYNILI